MTKRTKSQIGRASRRKGKSFERWCARYFTKWTGLKWETTRNSGRTDLKGDIYCVSKPDLPLIVECKDDKRYSVHAMLKPTKAFVDMFNKYRCRDCDTMIVLKNETGVWFWCPNHVLLTFAIPEVDKMQMAGRSGAWVRLQHITTRWFRVDEVVFHARRLEGASQKGKRQ